MYSNEQFMMFLEEQFEVKVDIDQIGSESVMLSKEELDDNLIPKEVYPYLPDPVLFQLFVYEEDIEWIVGVALEEATYNPLFLVCIKDGERDHYQMVN